MPDDVIVPKTASQEPDKNSSHKSAVSAPPDNVETIDMDKLTEEYGPVPSTTNDTEPSKPRIHRRFWTWVGSFDKGREIFYGVLALILILAAILAYILLHQPAPPPVASYPVYHKPTPTTVASTLTGLQVDPAVNKLQVTGVMIENSIFARPQSGLNQAGVVFEAIAEGGITRFLALFQDTQSSYIGPVRSARPYYLQWCIGFDCALAHVGGSPEALNDIKSWHSKDLNQFFGASFFHRTNRAAPHNVYTSSSKLGDFEKQKGYKTSSYTGFSHLAKAPAVTATSADTKSVDFNYPGAAYDVHYSYNQTDNNYARSEGDAKHYSVDSKGKKVQNAPAVVIALIMHYGLESDAHHSVYDTIGSGKMYVFQNGTVTKGTWSKASRSEQFSFKSTSGQTIQLNPGQTWISALGDTSDVTYK